MKTKVCPCCDQPISGIYCRGCRKIVLNPVVQDVHYYLNERHPENETDCSFHGKTTPETKTSDRVMTPFEAEAKKAEIKERMQTRGQEPKSSAKISNASNTRKTVLNGNTLPSKKTAESRASIVGITIFMVVFMNVLLVLLRSFHHSGYDFTLGQRTAETAASAYAEWEEWELSDEEVKAAGIACTGYGHFDITYEDARQAFLDCVDDAGYMWSEGEPYSYNQKMNEMSWFQTVYDYAIETEDAYIGTVEIETDTATGQIHGISLYAGVGEGFFETADIAAAFMKKVGMAGGELPDGRGFYEEAMENAGETQLEDGFCMMYGLEVSCYVPEKIEEPDFYAMSVYAPGYYTASE